MKTYNNALENRDVANYAEGESYYEIAVSRYYYSIYLIINKYLKDKLGRIIPPQGKDSHEFIINQFLKCIDNGEIEDYEIDILKEIHLLRKKRNDYEYDKNFNKSEKLFKKEFKTKYENIEGVLETHLLDYKAKKEKFEEQKNERKNK